MKQACCIITIAGLAGSVWGQNYILGIEGGPGQIDTSAGSVTFTVDIVGDAGVGLGTHLLWGSFGLQATGAIVEDIVWMPAAWSVFNVNDGYSGDGLFSFVEFGQWPTHGLPLNPGSELGSLIGQFQITLAQYDIGSGSLDLNLLSTASFGLSTIDIGTFESYYSTPETLVFEGFSVDIVPAPSSAMVLIGGGLLCARRRR